MQGEHHPYGWCFFDISQQLQIARKVPVTGAYFFVSFQNLVNLIICPDYEQDA